jgi:serine/threonine protein kinase
MLAKQFHADLLMKSVAQQLLEVVRAIHDIGLVHTAIRPSAIRLQSTGQLRLTGFHGAALAGSGRRAGEAGDMPDRWHSAPEALLSSSYPYAASMDMYSVGCVLAEILLQRQLYGGVTFAEHIASMFRLQGYNGEQELGFEPDTYAASIIQERCIFPPRYLATTFPNVGLQLCDLLSQLLTVNPAERITAEQALQHPFFTTMPTRYPAARRSQLAPPPADVFAFEEPGALDSAQLQQLISEEAKGYATEPQDVYDPLYLPLTCR